MSTYDPVFFDYVSASARQAAERVLPLLDCELQPRSVLDVGCGQGAWLAVWQSLGVTDVFGLDGSYVDQRQLQISAERFRAVDLREGFNLRRQFGFIQCLEVAEHLPASSAEALITSLTRHGRVILFSAAPPGQGGHGHVNEQPYEYWRAHFSSRQFLPLDFLRPRILDDPGIACWYRYNPLLYVHRATFPALSAALRSSLIPVDCSVPDLAPFGYRLRRQVVRHLPVAIMTTLAQFTERLFRSGTPNESDREAP